MKKQFPLEQTEELDAVVSCFGEEFVSVDWSGDELKGVISVVLEPRLQPVVISATDGKDYRQFETKQLSPVDLHFRLPVVYPAEQAMIDVDCMWMPTSMRNTMVKRLGDVVHENVGSAVLFLCCEDVKKFVDGTEITELRLEGNHFARKNKMRPMEVLDVVRRECEKAELLEFEGHCHDCDVCFENKLGRECVRFSPCGHTFCRECVTAYFNERLTAQEISPLTCLSDGCESSVPQKLIIELLGQEEFDRYERILLSRVLDTMDDLAVCPRITCQKPAARSQAWVPLPLQILLIHSHELSCINRSF
ncbi:hypothetical protein Y032_0308g2056 [Ancylostoma ceylanicum]|uniref:RING-type domain-containing protein n=1 Tax=Ancylostoma ceylanicum TaxID=53326 RepID=A0A016S3I4_9BILA|nr:hypothetical protein Y032_0308g2056 [Ancylostoma ceylanicum]